MKNLIIVCTLFLTTQVFAQVDFRKEYYPAVNRAEMAITKDDYQTAITEYQTAFSAVKTPLARDIFNAVACKFLLNDFEGAKPLLLKLASKGIEVQFLDGLEIFKLESIKNSWTEFKNIFTQISTIDNDRIDWKVKNELDGVEKSIEMAFASRYHKANFGDGFKYYKMGQVDYSRIKDIEYVKGLSSVDSLSGVIQLKVSLDNRNKSILRGRVILDSLIRNKLFFNEDVFGTNENDLSSNKIFKYFKFLRGEQYTLYKMTNAETKIENSFVSSDSLKWSLNADIIEAVKNGLIHPKLAYRASFFNDSLSLNFSKVYKIKIEDKTGCSQSELNSNYFEHVKTRKLNKGESALFDSVRQNYGIEELNSILQKQFYVASKNRYFIFLERNQYEETTVPNCEIAREMLVGATIIQD